MLFPFLPLLEFWFQAKYVYPKISKRAVRHLLPFATTYLCETTYGNRLNVEPDLRLKLSSCDPDMHKLTSEKQHQPSQSVSVKFIILGLIDMFIFIRKSPFIQYCIVIYDTLSVIKL
jgi:hypothetical protein